MNSEEIRRLIAQKIEAEKIFVTGNDGKYKAIVVSDIFIPMNAVSRHQSVYIAVGEDIANGKIHALSIATYTLAEYRQAGNPES